MQSRSTNPRYNIRVLKDSPPPKIFTSIVCLFFCPYNKSEWNTKLLPNIFNVPQRKILKQIYISAFSRHFYPKKLTVHFYTCRLYICIVSMCSLGIEPTTFALLMQCSTTEPLEHCIMTMFIFRWIILSSERLLDGNRCRILFRYISLSTCVWLCTCIDVRPQRTWRCWWQTHTESPLLSSYTDLSWHCTPPDLQCPGCPANTSLRQSQPAFCKNPAWKRRELNYHIWAFTCYDDQQSICWIN